MDFNIRLAKRSYANEENFRACQEYCVNFLKKFVKSDVMLLKFMSLFLLKLQPSSS